MTETTQLTVTQRAAVALQSDKAAAELAALVESSQSITAITNPAGRTECHSAAMTAKAARVAIEKTGKEARDDATAFSKAVIAEEKRLVAIIEPEQNRLLALRDDWDAKVEAEKEAKRREEAEKAAAITKKIDAIKDIPLQQVGKTAADIRNALQYVKTIEIDDSYGDQFGAAKEARGDVILKLIDMADAAEEREAEAARLAEEKRIADAKAEQDRIEREAEAKRQREENERVRIANEAEQARLKAEADRLRAETEAAAAKLKAEREAFEKQQAEAAEQQRQKDAAEAKAKADAEAAEKAKQQPDQASVSQNGASSPPEFPAVLSPAEAVAEPAPSAVATATGAASVAPIDNGARINLGMINAVLGFTVTAGYLADIGIDPAGTDKRAVLYRESDFPMICRAIANHVIDKVDAFLKAA